uniref:hypothetical protein n=1 Tax=Candidatus Rhodobacter oscarellae TaxID=1675527 RepID=UPI001F3CAEF6|nr:hypothetical protein [Candidatus Rhodobacter lobularis]
MAVTVALDALAPPQDVKAFGATATVMPAGRALVKSILVTAPPLELSIVKIIRVVPLGAIEFGVNPTVKAGCAQLGEPAAATATKKIAESALFSLEKIDIRAPKSKH